MRHISSNLKKVFEKNKKTERGEIMRYFMERLNDSRRQDGIPALTMGRMGKLLEKIPTKDLYYLKSVCDSAQNFSKKFWYELNPGKYEKKQK